MDINGLSVTGLKRISIPSHAIKQDVSSPGDISAGFKKLYDALNQGPSLEEQVALLKKQDAWQAHSVIRVDGKIAAI